MNNLLHVIKEIFKKTVLLECTKGGIKVDYYNPSYDYHSIRVYQLFTIIFHILLFIFLHLIMLALCSMLSMTHYVQKLYWHNRWVHAYLVAFNCIVNVICM